MVFSVTTLTYVGIFAILAYQLGAGVHGLIKRQPLGTFHLFLFLLFLASELSRSFFPVYVKTLLHPGQDPTLAMALPQIVWGLSALIATPYGWLLAKKIGQKKVLIASAATTAVALIVTGFTDNYVVMLVARAVVSIGYGIANIVAVIYLSNQGVRAKIMGILWGAIATSSICGNSIGGLLTSRLSYSEIFGVSAASAVVALLVLLVFFHDPHTTTVVKAKPSYKRLMGDWNIQCFAVLNTMPYRFVLTGFILYLIPVLLTQYHWSLQAVGQVMMTYFLLNYLLVKPCAWLLDRFNSYRSVALISTIVTAVGLMMFGQHLTNTLGVYVGIVVIAVGMAFNTSVQIPIVPVLFVKECEIYGRDTLLAYFRTVERVGSVLGPLLTAVLFKVWPHQVLTIIGVVLMLLSAGLLALFMYRARPNQTPPSTIETSVVPTNVQA